MNPNDIRTGAYEGHDGATRTVTGITVLVDGENITPLTVFFWQGEKLRRSTARRFARWAKKRM